MTASRGHRIAVILPCHNEAGAIARVIDDFREALPEAVIYVYDNNSNDSTVETARQHGAILRHERRQGKGHVVRRMFADIEADIYILADGDGTYHAASSSTMVDCLLADNLDMVVGIREEGAGEGRYRRGHQFGNRLFTRIVRLLFGDQFSDILSGYRVMSRRFVKSFPAITQGFEIEAQLAIHALDLGLPCTEISTPYAVRPAGTQSKLRTWRDGTRILLAILRLFKETRPLSFFGLLSLLLAVVSAGLGAPLIIEYLQTGLVPRFPTAVLASGLGVMAGIFVTAGVILDTVARNHRELKRIAYSSIPAAQTGEPRR